MVFMNGDLGPYHLLYEPDRGELAGIIDFGIAGMGDPATDFACLIDNYGESFVRRMVRHYPALTELIDRARFWAGTLELQWALNGLRSDDLSWRTVHIGRAHDEMPIGSPMTGRRQLRP
jgi:aminoglycoside 2''-phosphotransferase